MNLIVMLCVMSKCFALHHTLHLTYLRYVSHFMYFVCKRVYRSCEALTVVLLGIQVFQDATQCCLDLLLDKYLNYGQRAAQIMHSIR